MKKKILFVGLVVLVVAGTLMVEARSRRAPVIIEDTTVSPLDPYLGQPS